MKRILLFLINFYQKTISPDHGLVKRPTCVFYPTCSEYSKLAITKYGGVKGLYLTIKRILRCHPWQKNHLDPLK